MKTELISALVGRNLRYRKGHIFSGVNYLHDNRILIAKSYGCIRLQMCCFLCKSTLCMHAYPFYKNVVQQSQKKTGKFNFNDHLSFRRFIFFPHLLCENSLHTLHTASAARRILGEHPSIQGRALFS